MKNKWRVSAKWPACLTPKKTTAWNVRKPCRKRNGTLNWRNAWPAPPTPPEAMNALQDTMAQAYQEAREKVQEQQMEQETQAEQSLQNEWGGSYERNMGRATAALQRLASETGVDADALLDNPALGSNPDVIRLLYQVSRLLDEAPLHQAGAAAPSPAEEAMRMESDPSHPLYEAYMSVNHPNHKYANELYDRLTSR